MNKYIRAVVINFLFFGINILFFLIVTPVALNTMGEEFFGLWSIINAVLGFTSIGNLGLGVAVNKFAAEEIKDTSYLNKIITAGVLIMIPMAIISGGVLILARGIIIPRMNIPEILRDDFSRAMVITAFCLIPQFLSEVAYGFLYSQLKNRLLSITSLLSQIATWVGAILIAVNTRNLKFMAFWLLFVNLITMFWYYYVIHGMTGFRPLFSASILRRMTKFSFFTFLSTLAIIIYQQFDRIFVGFSLGPVAAGAFAVGTSLSLRLSIITGQMTDVMVPYASRKDSEKEHSFLYINFRNLTHLINILLVVLSGLLVIWMKEILELWISYDYARNYHFVFSVLIFAYTILSLSRPGHQTLTGIGKVEFTSGIYFFTSLAMVAGIYFLSSRYGLIGAAIAKVSSILLLLFNLKVQIQLKGRISLKEFIADIGWAIIAAFIGIALIILNASVVIRLLYSILIITFSIIWCFRDKFVRSQILYFYKKTIALIKKQVT